MTEIKICGEVRIVANITGNFTIVVNPAGGQPLAMNPQGGNLPAATVGVDVGTLPVCTVSGGTAPYSMAISAGSVPPGLNIGSVTNPDSSETISLQGVPAQSGAFSFSLTVTDAAGASGTVKVGG